MSPRALISSFVVAAALISGISAASANSAGSVPYSEWDHHIPFNVYFKEEHKEYKPGYGYVVNYHTCYYTKVYDSRNVPFVKKVCE